MLCAFPVITLRVSLARSVLALIWRCGTSVIGGATVVFRLCFVLGGRLCVRPILYLHVGGHLGQGVLVIPVFDRLVLSTR